MVNILLERSHIDAQWLYDDLKAYIQPDHTVAVVAFSFRDDKICSATDWNALYGKAEGKY